MARVIIKETDRVILYHHTGITYFKGCQCFKDCTCNDDFIPSKYDIYSVFKKFNKPRTTHHNTLEEAHKRIDFLGTIKINSIWKPCEKRKK